MYICYASIGQYSVQTSSDFNNHLRQTLNNYQIPFSFNPLVRDSQKFFKQKSSLGIVTMRFMQIYGVNVRNVIFKGLSSWINDISQLLDKIFSFNSSVEISSLWFKEWMCCCMEVNLYTQQQYNACSQFIIKCVQLDFSQQINFYHQISKAQRWERMQNIQQNHPGFSSNNPKSDQEFFNSLKNYQPLFYSGKGVPLLMTNHNWHQSLICLGTMDVLYIIPLVFFIIRNGKNDEPTYKGYSGLQTTTMLIISVLILLLANISVILTQLFNPGIVNPSSITDSQYVKSGGKKWCTYCNAYVCQDMEHCRECHVCIWGLDHHCGYFNKCIGGYQKFLFYCALTFGFLGFINILLLLSSLIL